jgi:hypothetical protein
MVDRPEATLAIPHKLRPVALPTVIALVASLSLLSPGAAQASSATVAPDVIRYDGQAQVGAYGCQPLDAVRVDGINQNDQAAHWDSSRAREFRKGSTTFSTWNWWWKGQVTMRIKLQNGGWSIPIATQIPPRPSAVQDPFLVPCSYIIRA